jgi:hypothetical protein
MLCSSSCSKNRKNSSATSYIHYNFILKINWVFLNCILISFCSGSISQHFFMNMVGRITIKIVVMFISIVEINIKYLLVELIIIKPLFRTTWVSVFCGFVNFLFFIWQLKRIKRINIALIQILRIISYI